VRALAVLGSTGSIGRNTLDVVRRHPDRWRIAALAARRDVETLARQAIEVRPEFVAVADEDAAAALGERLRAAAAAFPGGRPPEIAAGAAAVVEASRRGDIVVNALVGAAGLRASAAALSRGVRLALANKESLVVGGELLTALARRTGGEIVPIDSEHAGLFHLLGGTRHGGVEAVGITASGGALRDHADWRRATPAEVLAHPVWQMGARITVDSATLVNKGFEVIEARWLFDLALDRIRVALHPQAWVHAWVEWIDGSIEAQLALPDMRLPIQMALSWPERLPAAIERLDLTRAGRLDFAPVSESRYPGFAAALAAARTGGLAPAVLNAADEEAVRLFLEGRLPLGELPALLETVLAAHPGGAADSLEAIEDADRWARAETHRAAVRA
jgi:1-deoxy-D-xylulose-5-phosphate reductoisomerase